MENRRFAFFIAAAVLASGGFVGCAVAPVAPSPAEDAKAAVDREILEASKSIQRSQLALFQAGAINAAAVTPPAKIDADGQAVTLVWTGDASELLAKLAKDRGLEFVETGVRLPLPVSVRVTGEPFAGVLELVRSQIGYRGQLVQEGGRLLLNYNRPQS